MNAPMRMAPSCSIFGATSTSTNPRATGSSVGADRHHRRDAAERRADEHRRLRAAPWRSRTRHRRTPRGRSRRRRASRSRRGRAGRRGRRANPVRPARCGRTPREPGLPATVEQHDRRAVGVAELVGAEPQAVAPAEVDRADVVGARHRLRLPATWAWRWRGRPCTGCRGRPPTRGACPGPARRSGCAGSRCSRRPGWWPAVRGSPRPRRGPMVSAPAGQVSASAPASSRRMVVLRSADVAVNSLVIAADCPTSAPVLHAQADALHEAALHDVEHVRLGDELTGDGIVGGAAGGDDLHAAGVECAVGAFGEVVASAHVRRAAADRVALVREQRQRDGPAVVHVADDGVGRERARRRRTPGRTRATRSPA